MKMHLNKTIQVLPFLLLSVFIFSCVEDGEMGPAGADGATGPQGVAGQDGEDGNANVIYSDWFYPVWNITDESKEKTMEISNDQFTLAQDNGVVLLYWATQDGSTHLLPWNTYNELSGSISISREYNLKRASGKLELTIKKYGLLETFADDSETEGKVGEITYNQLRYVIIPGGVAASNSRVAAVDYQDYEAVKEYYNIPD